LIRQHLPSLLAALAFMGLITGSVADARVSENAAPNDAAPAKHHIQTVFIVLMENHNWTGDGSLDIKGNPAAPYINKTLLPISSHAENYYNPPGIHPSLPNYLWLVTGQNFGIRDDNPPSQHLLTSHKHLVAQFEKAGITWKSYDENVTGKVCPLVDGGGIDPDGNSYYAVRHNPFVYFNDINDHLNPHSAYCIQHVRPYSELAVDLKNNKAAQFNFITPNVCDDMHDDCAGNPIAHGDTWLSRNVPAILKSAAYKSGGVLFIVWDEADRSDGPIGMIVLSPFAKGNGYSNHLRYTHGSTLRTVEEIFSLPFLADANKEQDLSGLFRAFP